MIGTPILTIVADDATVASVPGVEACLQLVSLQRVLAVRPLVVSSVTRRQPGQNRSPWPKRLRAPRGRRTNKGCPAGVAARSYRNGLRRVDVFLECMTTTMPRDLAASRERGMRNAEITVSVSSTPPG